MGPHFLLFINEKIVQFLELYMSFIKKFENRKLFCTCKNLVSFEIIDEIECDWGSHVVIQCPQWESLYSADKQCPAFQSVLDLIPYNSGLISNIEKSYYLSNAHT